MKTALCISLKRRSKLDKFIEIHRRKKIKAGCVGMKLIEIRYSGIGVFKKLDTHSFFCKTLDYELAITYEEKLKELLVELNVCKFQK